MAEGGQAGTELAPSGAAAGLSLERVGALAGDLHGRWQAMSAERRRWIAVSALLVAAVASALAWYGGRTDWRVLFSGLDAKDTQQIAQELSAAGIATQMTEDGTGIEVGADQLDKARMEVATKGMPQSGRMGFELFDKPNWVGSEFDEKVNYQRALEGELEHTIGTLAAVRSARVHLVLPKDELFGDEKRQAKASVVLTLRKSTMPPEQVEAIRSLVAGAVENLNPEDVTLVDADGRLNLAAPSQGSEASDAERLLEEKLVAMLEPVAGAGNVRATVNVAYDESSEEKTDEVYDPTQVAALSLHKSEQMMGAKPRAAGVPGTASNTPGPAVPGGVHAAAKTAAAAAPATQTANGAASKPVQKDAGLPVYPESGPQGETITEETGSYAVTRHELHSEQEPGRIRRVTAAVVVNDRMEREGAGKAAHTEWKPRSAEEMHQFEQLARASVGFDATRGDQVVIENVSFSSNTPEAAPLGMAKVMDETNALLHTQPELLKTVCVSAVGLVLVLMVVKPMSRQMMAALSQTPAAPLQAPGGAQGGGRSAGVKGLGQAGGQGFVLPKRPGDAPGIYEHISEQIRREPAQSTRLLESWINAPVEEED